MIKGVSSTNEAFSGTPASGGRGSGPVESFRRFWFSKSLECLLRLNPAQTPSLSLTGRSRGGRCLNPARQSVM
jgi:hypothetical protein